MEEDKVILIKQTIEELLQKMTMAVFDVKIRTVTEEKTQQLLGVNTIYVDIVVEEPQILIGQNGQTLFELSRLLRIILNKKLQENFYLDVDINDYKKKKIEYLKDLAQTMADQVVLTKERKVLPPMPAYERRIIHAQLSTRQDITTQSQGEGMERCVVIVPK